MVPALNLANGVHHGDMPIVEPGRETQGKATGGAREALGAYFELCQITQSVDGFKILYFVRDPERVHSR